MTEYDAVVFDSDGVLVEPPTLEAKLEATHAAFREVGVRDPDDESVLEIVHGTTVDELESICRRYDLEPAAFWDARERLDERRQLEAFAAGDRDRYDDVAAIDDLTGPRGVVSNNHHSTIAFVLDRFDLASLFETYYGREMTIESLRLKKPNTHYLECALSDLGVAPESTLYVGDSESDVVAATRSGMDVAFVRRAHCRDATLSVDPTYEVADLYAVTELVESGRG